MWALWTSVAIAGGGETICVTAPRAPQSQQLALPDLDWRHRQRHRLARGEPLELEPGRLFAWFSTDLEAPRSGVGARVSVVEDQLVVELAAARRRPVVAPDLVVAVDVSLSMDSVFTRGFPALGAADEGPIRRIDLAREALQTLVDGLDRGARLSIVAFDGLTGRVVTTPAHLPQDRGSIQNAVAALQTRQPVGPSLLAPQLTALLRAPDAHCRDTRLVVLTDRRETSQFWRSMEKMRRRVDGTVEIWSLTIRGPGDPVSAEAPVGVRAIDVRSAADVAEVWDTMLDPGGVTARGVVVTVHRDDGSTARWNVGDLDSGEKAVQVFAHTGGQARVRLTVAGQTFVVPRSEPGDSSRWLAAAARWIGAPERGFPEAVARTPASTELAWWVARSPTLTTQTSLEPSTPEFP